MNPNKLVGGGGVGAALGTAIIYVAGRLGAHLTPEDGAMVATTSIVLLAALAHNGIRGSLRVLWRGSNPPAPPPAA